MPFREAAYRNVVCCWPIVTSYRCSTCVYPHWLHRRDDAVDDDVVAVAPPLPLTDFWAAVHPPFFHTKTGQKDR
jgi:hypothetical protein